MKTRAQIVEKMKEYYNLSKEKQNDLKNIGFYEALFWIISDEDIGL